MRGFKQGWNVELERRDPGHAARPELLRRACRRTPPDTRICLDRPTLRRWRNGRRGALKRPCPKGCVGSNPTRRIDAPATPRATRRESDPLGMLSQAPASAHVGRSQPAWSARRRLGPRRRARAAARSAPAGRRGCPRAGPRAPAARARQPRALADQRAGGDVPLLDRALEVGVVAPRRGPARSSAALPKRRMSRTRGSSRASTVAWARAHLGVVREARRDHRARQLPPPRPASLPVRAPVPASAPVPRSSSAPGGLLSRAPAVARRA